MKNLHQLLKQYWGYQSFRPLQEDIMNTILQGKDCLALLPTGGGKSLCFQVPTLAMDGLCLVVSPLIALMKDQVENLRRKNITAFSIHSGMNRAEVMQTLQVAGNSNCKFLYVSPERLETNLFKEYLPSLGVRLIAVDEAHCISQWGYDFRPSYLKIASLRDELPGIPILALTASATADVQDDICEKLLFTKHKIFRQSFERPNLSYSTFDVSSKTNKIVEILSKVGGTGIVYCRSRRRTKEISDLLRMNGIAAECYHAGLKQDERNARQEEWLTNKVRVIVCTNAFGMGIDKPDVRIVIHADAPDCLENYYQEAGRAGRDGKKSYAVLLYAQRDLDDLVASVKTRFPPVPEIRKIYQSLMNYLQIPAGSGEGSYYDFQLTEFKQHFNHDTFKVTSVLKTLEQEELLTFNEQVFVPSKLQVIAGREQIHAFEERFPSFEPLIKSLLRTYEGIIDQPCAISEKNIARTLKTEEQQVTARLQQLQRHRIVDYVPVREKPQVYLLKNRVKASDLKINTKNYNKRKKIFEDRVLAMKNYTSSPGLCRSVVIGNYFGDKNIQPCGICDNCINRKKEEIKARDFREIHDSILEMIRVKPLTMPEILNGLMGVRQEKTKEVIHFMQSEDKIGISDEGKIFSRAG